MEVDNLKRQVTHTEYTNRTKKKLQKLLQVVKTEISVKPYTVDRKEVEKDPEFFISVSDKFYSTKFPRKTIPLLIGGFSLLMFIGFLFARDPWDVSGTIIRLIPIVVLIFCIVYYFTMPRKATILNRIDQTITFPGAFWQPNYTMPYKIITFVASSPSRNLSPPTLQIVRPNSWFYDNSFAMGGCYEDLSFITWYMDKNRPLPLGTAFDPYRQRDFERRKAEGFPPPLYRSAIPTPEATLEQQKEREKYWKDYEHRPDPNNEDFAIPSI